MRRRVALCLVAALISSGCTYHGVLVSDDAMFTPPAYARAAELAVEFDDSGSRIRDFSLAAFPGTYTISAKQAVIESFSNTLNQAFRTVTLSSQARDRSDLLFIPVLEHEPLRRDHWNANFDYQATTTLEVRDGYTRKLLGSFTDKRVISYAPPGSVRFLGFMTGLTLFLASPITIPATTHIAGEHARDLSEEALRNSVREISLELFAAQDVILDQVETERELRSQESAGQ